MTQFKPFSIRELEYDVWDTSRAKNEELVNQFDQRGLLMGSKNSHSNRLGNSNGQGGQQYGY